MHIKKRARLGEPFELVHDGSYRLDLFEPGSHSADGIQSAARVILVTGAIQQAVTDTEVPIGVELGRTLGEVTFLVAL